MELFLRRKDRTGNTEGFRKSLSEALGRNETQPQDHQFESPSQGGKLPHSKGMNQIDANEPMPNYKPSLFMQDGKNSIYSEDKMLATPDITEPESKTSSKLFGMDRPSRPKPKWYDYALGLGLPALQAGLSGQGALSGMVSGASNMFANKFKNQSRDIADWEKDRAFGQKEREIEADAALAGRKLQLDSEDKAFDRGIKREELNIRKNPVRAKGPNDPDPTEERAYQSLSPAEVTHLTSATPDKLMEYMAAPDPSMRKAAKHVWKLKNSGKQLSNPMQQFMLDQMSQ